MSQRFTATGHVPGCDAQWSTKPGMPGWYTIYIPKGGASDGLRVLGSFTYSPGGDKPCVADRDGSTCCVETFTAALAWCGLPVRSLTDDPATAICQFLTEHLVPTSFLQLAAHADINTYGKAGHRIIDAVIAAGAELEGERDRPDSEILADIITAARLLLPASG